MALTTPLTELLEIRLPVILAPMAWVSGGALAAMAGRARPCRWCLPWSTRSHRCRSPRPAAS